MMDSGSIAQPKTPLVAPCPARPRVLVAALLAAALLAPAPAEDEQDGTAARDTLGRWALATSPVDDTS